MHSGSSLLGVLKPVQGTRLEGVVNTWTCQFCYLANIYSVLLTTEVAATEVNRQNEINLP